MNTLLVSETQSPLGRAVRDLAVSRGLTVTVAGSTAEAGATLVVTDLAAALKVRLDAATGSGLSEGRHAEIAAMIAAAADRGNRVVLVAGPLPGAGHPGQTAAANDAQRIEAIVADQTAKRAVILRVSDVMDPADPDLHAAIRALIDGSPTALWPASDQVQGIGLADLAAATVGATQSRGIDGKWFDVVHPEPASRVAVQGEVQRIARLLVDPDLTEVQSRPPYQPVTARRDGAAAVAALNVRPKSSVFVLLAQAIQGMIANSVRQGAIPAIRPPMPAAHRALETGDLPLAGRCAVVTGATGQIGSALSRILVRLGANVVGVARRADAGAEMERTFSREHAFLDRQRRRLDAERVRRDGGAPIGGSVGGFSFVSSDLADFSALPALAARLMQDLGKIDILIHAAGSVSRYRQENPQGIEAVLALHMLSPVALTRLLGEALSRAGSAWVVNPVSAGHVFHPYELDHLQSREAYAPAEVLARAHSGLVALTGALAVGMAGSGVKIAAVALPQVRTPFRLPLEDEVSGGATARQVAETQRSQRRAQMESPAEAAGKLVEVMLAAEFEHAHGCLLQTDGAARPILTPSDDRDRLNALWAKSALLTGLPE